MKKQLLLAFLLTLLCRESMAQIITFDNQGHTPGQILANPYTIVDNGETFSFTISGGSITNHIYRTTEPSCGSTGMSHIYAGNTSQNKWTIETTSGNEIDLGTITFDNVFSCFAFSYSLTIQGFKDNVSTGVQTISVSGLNQIFTSNASFNDVDRIEINCPDLAQLGIDNINWVPSSPPCTEPSIPTITASTNPVCVGNSATLNISGNLNDATQWHIYTGSCGGTLVGTTAGSTFVVSPTTTTSYFIRGEGGCTTPGTCGSVVVTVNALDDASFAYSQGFYCRNAVDPAPTITGLGGTFSSVPAGLSLASNGGNIDASASSPGTYTVTYTTTGACPNFTAQTLTILDVLNANFSYLGQPYCTSGSDPTPNISSPGGSFSSTPGGLSIIASTGEIDVSASTPGTYTVTYTTPGACPQSINRTVTIDASDDASFNYSAASYCVTDADPIPTITGSVGGGFTAFPGGLSINASTGAIDVSASPPGAYTVTYLTIGTCPALSNVAVTIIGLDDPSFNYSAASYCTSDADPAPTITGTSGGAFTAVPGGLSISGATGAIDLSASTPGSYTVTYSTAGTCSASSNVAVTINASDDASFNYSAAFYCVTDADPTPTITGLAGGTFSSTAGLSLNASTGVVNVSTSTPGTYTVGYTTPGTCAATSDQVVTINALDDPSFNYSSASYCANDSDPTPTITGLTGGSFSSIPLGLSLNTSTGAIDVSASTPGAYTVTYTTNGSCLSSSNVAVTINAVDDASFNYSSASYCVTDTDPTPTITGLGGGSFSSTPGLSINGGTGAIDVSASTTGAYTVTYTTIGPCPNTSNVVVTINALDDPSFSYGAASYCTNESDPTPTITGLGGGGFTSSPAGLSINAGTGAIDVSLSIPNTYTVTYTTTGSCPNSSNVAVTINAIDDASFTYSAASYCVNESDPTPTITGLAGGSFSSTPGLSINGGTGAIDVSASTPGPYTVTYTTSGPCPNTSNVVVTINALDDPSFSYSASTYCSNGSDPTPTITGLTGGSFSSTSGLIFISTGTGQIDLSASTPGTYSVTYTTAGACPNSSNVSVTINAPSTGSMTALADLCINAGVQSGLGGGTPTGGVYSGPGVTDDGNGMTYSFDPAAAGVGVHTITYTPGGACSTAGTDQVEVFALPTVTFTALADLCIDAGVQAGLGSGSPTGGVYSGAGVTDNGNGTTYSFDPAAAGVGTHTITYTITNANGCTNTAVDQVEVFALPTVTFTALADLCVNDGVQAGLGSGSPTGGVYSGAGVTDDGNGMTYSFDPAAAGVGTHTITYTFINANGCTSSANDAVEVIAVPTVTYTAPGPFCSTQGVQSGLGSGSPTGGVYSGAGVTDDGNGTTYSFDPAAAGVGTHTVTYSVNTGGCIGSANDDIVVTAGGTVTAVCQDVTIYLDANGDATLTALDIDGGSSVGCGVLNLVASQTAFTCADATIGPIATNDLVISGVYDGPLTGGTPKGVELYVINDIADLSQYGIGSANNGGGTDGEEFTFPAVAATAGQYIYVASETPQFTNWFGFAPDYTDASMSINGDDAVELFYQTNVIDVFGDINTDGTGQTWDFLDGWAYRNNDTGPDGSAWNIANWSFSGINVLDGETSNATAATPVPVGTYSITVATPTTVTLTVTDGLGGSATCDANVTILDTISPTITCPVDIVQDQDAGVCSADVTVPNIVTADSCSGETISWTVSGATTATGTGQPGLQTFAFGLSTVDVTATDASGNTANCSFTVTVNDTVAPTLPVLADSIGECSVTVAAPTTADNCNGTITGTTTDPTIVATQGTTVITWTFDDGSGNVTTATQNVIINDAVAPTATNIDTAFAECIGDVAIDITLVDDEADNCTAAPVVAYVSDVASNGTGCNDTITRTYSVTDDEGNSINVEQIIILNDLTAPTASNPITLNVVCLGDVPTTAGAASWVTDEADNCGNPIVTWLNDVSSNGTGCNDTITRTFEVADACGNSIQVQQMIIVNDDNVPVADVANLADVTATCDASPTAPTATDNCAGTLNGVPDVTFPISTVGTTVVTWTYTDNCGNTATQTQNVTVTGVDVGTTMASDNITMIATNINAGVTYQWYDCVAGTIVAGETNVNFTPSYGSDFAVIVTENGCVDTSACVNSTVGLDQLQLEQFVMYPNPTETGSFSIQLDIELKEVSVLDMTGRLVEVDVNLTEKTVNVSNLVNGAYIVRIITETEQELVGTVRVQ